MQCLGVVISDLHSCNDVFVRLEHIEAERVSTFRESSFLPSLEKVAHAQTAHRHERRAVAVQRERHGAVGIPSQVDLEPEDVCLG